MDIRIAEEKDLDKIIDLLLDDDLGVTREKTNSNSYISYQNAFHDIEQSTDNFLYVADLDEEIIGMMQLTLIPNISREGAKRAQIESVRIRRDLRSKGLGKKLIDHAFEVSKKHGCKLIQLTTDKTRARAHKFYLDLGFEDNHIGMKKYL